MLVRVLLCAVDAVYMSAHRVAMPRACSDDGVRPGIPGGGRGVWRAPPSPVWWRGARLSNQTRTSLGSYELYGLRCVTFIECFT